MFPPWKSPRRALLAVLASLPLPTAPALGCHAPASDERAPAAPAAIEAVTAAAFRPRRVAVVVFEGVELLDFAGPVEVFASARDNERVFFDVELVAARTGPLETAQAATLFVRHTPETCPPPDLIVVPGGEIGALDDATRAWIGRASETAEITMSVCNGAFVLAELGLLDGMEATTFWSFTDALQREVPSARVRKDVRVCDNGRIVTTAGISAGIDGALHLVERLCGEDIAFKTARGMEYAWTPTPLAPGAADTERRTLAREAARAHAYGRFEESSAAFAALLEQAPGEPRAARHLGEALRRLGRDEDAALAYRRAVETDPTDALAWDSLARLRLASGAASEAATCFERAIEHGWGFPPTWARLAGARNAAGDGDGALDALRTALEMDWGDRPDLQLDPRLASLAAEPRFRELLREHARAAPLQIAADDEPGERLEIQGELLDAHGVPVANALVSVYQTDASARYSAADTPTSMDEAHARLFGFLRTGPDGGFAITTVRPGGYPATRRIDGADRLIPAHVHLDVVLPEGTLLQKQVVFRDDPRLDEHWLGWARELEQPLAEPVRGADGIWSARVTLRP